MSNQQSSYHVHQPLEEDLHGLRAGWIWFLLLGVGLMVIGLLAIGFAFITTLVTVVVLGMLIFAGGILQVVSAFWSPRWSGMFLHVLMGLLYSVVGFMLMDSPIAAAAGLTLLIAVFLLVGGSFRIVTALMMRFRMWGIYLLNGVVTLMLGIIIWRHMLDADAAFLWIIGIFVGIEMLFCGAGWVAFALSVKNLPLPSDSPAPSA